MKHKRLKLSAILSFCIALTGLQAQTLYVKQSNGTQTAYSLNNLRRITFSSVNVTILKTNNSTGVYALNGLRYLNFTDLSTSISKPLMLLDNSNMVAYPNPVSDVLNIDLRGIDGLGTLSILTLEGKVMQTQQTSGNSLVIFDLIHLSQGIYLCQYLNANSIKTVKIIKQ